MKLFKITGRRFLGLLLVLALAGAGIGLYKVHYRWKWAVARYQRQLRAAGEKLTIAELIPPLVPPEVNRVGAYREASIIMSQQSDLLEHNPPPTMRMVAPGRAMIGFLQPDLRLEKTNTWEEADADLAMFNEGFESLGALIESPCMDFQLAYNDGAFMMLPHLAPLKRVATRLSEAVVCDLHRGDPAAAAHKLRILVGLVQSIKDERLVISQLVRASLASLALRPTWELTQAQARVSDADLAAVQADWAKLDFTPSAEMALAMDRAITQFSIRQMRESSAEFRRTLSFGSWGGPAGGGSPSLAQIGQTALEQTALRGQEGWWRFAWSYPDEYRALQASQVLLDTMRDCRREGCFGPEMARQQARLQELGLNSDSEQFGWMPGPGGRMALKNLFAQAAVSVHNLSRKVLVCEAGRQLAVTAIALQRHRLRQGSFPADLPALVPELLPAVPRDPVDGQPLRYRRQEGGGFLLYSVGEDGKDSQGDPKSAKESKFLPWSEGADWVWPQPATPEEIAAFLAKQNGKKR